MAKNDSKIHSRVPGVGIYPALGGTVQRNLIPRRLYDSVAKKAFLKSGVGVTEFPVALSYEEVV